MRGVFQIVSDPVPIRRAMREQRGTQRIPLDKTNRRMS